jgi:fluoride exporter
MTWQLYAALFVAGGIGTLARFTLGMAVSRWLGGNYPWATASVNLLGCLLFGFFWTLAEQRQLIGPETKLVVLVGFMGGFTTFSSYAFETAEMLSYSQWGHALGNIALQNGMGIAAVFAGFILGRNV